MELIARNSVKIYELTLFIWKYKSSKPKKKFLVFSITFKQLTQSEINLVLYLGICLGLSNPMENNQRYRHTSREQRIIRTFESNACLLPWNQQCEERLSSKK